MGCHWWGSEFVDSPKQGEKGRGQAFKLFFFIGADCRIKDGGETIDVAFWVRAGEKWLVASFEIEIEQGVDEVG